MLYMKLRSTRKLCAEAIRAIMDSVANCSPLKLDYPYVSKPHFYPIADNL